MTGFWDTSKNDLEEARQTLRAKERQLEELEERHQMEIKVYKQKVSLHTELETRRVTELDR